MSENHVRTSHRPQAAGPVSGTEQAFTAWRDAVQAAVLSDDRALHERTAEAFAAARRGWAQADRMREGYAHALNLAGVEVRDSQVEQGQL